ncbi:MAG: type VII toxin-antitoxin system MntA family adenylyltransferase antitoxin [Bacilli bacterium]
MSMARKDRRSEILERVRQIALQAMQGFPCTIYLFGSFARGDEQTSSDIDVGIEAPTTVPFDKLSNLRQEFEDSTIPYRVDVVDLNTASATLRDKVRKEGIRWSV